MVQKQRSGTVRKAEEGWRNMTRRQLVGMDAEWGRVDG